MSERTFYQSEDGDECYLPVANWQYREARSKAASIAEELVGEWGRSCYTGKRVMSLHDHGEWETCTECPAVPCWCFDLYEGTYRP